MHNVANSQSMALCWATDQLYHFDWKDRRHVNFALTCSV
jgi:hypothetical protein